MWEKKKIYCSGTHSDVWITQNINLTLAKPVWKISFLGKTITELLLQKKVKYRKYFTAYKHIWKGNLHLKGKNCNNSVKKLFNVCIIFYFSYKLVLYFVSMQIWLDVLPITRAHRSILCVEILADISIKESTALQINLIPSWSTQSSTLKGNRPSRCNYYRN